jgi:hypothetical protein
LVVSFENFCKIELGRHILVIGLYCLQVVFEGIFEVAACMINFTENEINVASNELNLQAVVRVLSQSVLWTAVGL